MFAISDIQVDRVLQAQLSGSTSFGASLLEKDYVITSVLEIVSRITPPTGSIQFGGGTSLVKAWRLPNRLSEDIDLKYAPHTGLSRNQQNQSLRTFRAQLEEAFHHAGLAINSRVGGEAPSEFFSVNLGYQSRFESASPIETLVRVECKRESILVSPEPRPIQSIADIALGFQSQEVYLLCTRPEEIAAQKAWIVLGEIQFFTDRKRDTRHLFDLWQLNSIDLDWDVLRACFRQVQQQRSQRSFTAAFWQAASSKLLEDVFESELAGLTPDLPDFAEVLGVMRLFEQLLET